ncbi:hypothetical protein FUAX_07610 [Fulvitalea axinellae]|uniref:J domain-containing protein n=1 Tax=Fulvitalea axinellae TaxID=1182444 RepID=A0AAU9D1L6_9BACT|nr:hypothetical protein FUAX_07610 [Fulvitalea axinellae]
MVDYYKILGVARDASGECIRESFQKMRKAGEATDMPSVRQAFKVLSNPDMREEYDRRFSDAVYKVPKNYGVISRTAFAGMVLCLSFFTALLIWTVLL